MSTLEAMGISTADCFYMMGLIDGKTRNRENRKARKARQPRQTKLGTMAVPNGVAMDNETGDVVWATLAGWERLEAHRARVAADLANGVD